MLSIRWCFVFYSS